MARTRARATSTCADAPGGKMSERMELGLPDKLELRAQGTGIEIVRKWFGWKVILTTAFAVFSGWSQ